MSDNQEQDREVALTELRALSRPAMDFSTPEGAILCLENAYRRRDIETAVGCKDFQVEAVLLLARTMPDLANDPETLEKTAEVLELGFRKEKTENWPDMQGVESFFVDRQPGFEDLSIVIVTEIVAMPDGRVCEDHLQVCCRNGEWRVLSAVEVESEDGKTLRHHGWVGDKALPETTGQNRDAIARHIEKVWGENQFVLLDSKQEYVEIGVHIVPATTERPYHTLITSGMSDRPMPAPEGAEDLRFAELVISLPPDWPLDSNSLGSDEFGWPLRELVWLARFPHQYGTWIMPGHIIPNGESADPYVPNTDFCCILLATPVLCEEGGEELPLDAEAKIHFHSVIPIFREEMEFKTEHGVDGLMEKLADREVCELLDLNRPNVCG